MNAKDLRNRVDEIERRYNRNPRPLLREDVDFLLYLARFGLIYLRERAEMPDDCPVEGSQP